MSICTVLVFEYSTQLTKALPGFRLQYLPSFVSSLPSVRHRIGIPVAAIYFSLANSVANARECSFVRLEFGIF